MPAQRYTLRIPEPTSTATTFNVPLDMDFQLVDQGETIERQFVDVEVEKSINPIIDYEKVRFIPKEVTILADMVKYVPHFWDAPNTDYFNPTYFSDLGYTNDDLKFRKNSLIKSFLRLDFYDSPIVTDQNLISIIYISPDIRLGDILPNSQVIPAANKPVSFILMNPLGNNENFGEGFFIYHYKDEVTNLLPKELFMRATYSNAKTGKSTNMMTAPYDANAPIFIDDLQGQLHTKYTLKRDNTGFYYDIDTTQSNVEFTANTFNVDLYEIKVA